MASNAVEALVYMLIAHALCDYPLQGDWLSKAKNHKLDLVPGETIWPLALASHAAIHAGAVKLVTGSWLLAAIEFIAHANIDHSKCDGDLTYNEDQLMHIGSKLCLAALFGYGIL